MATSQLNRSVNLEPTHNHVWKLFLTAHILLTEQIEQELAAAGLPSLSWYDVLWSLEQVPEHKMRLHELADAMLLRRSNLTRLIDRMEVAGLVCRRSCTVDRRGAFAAITATGLEMRQKMWGIYSGAIAQHFGQHLDEAEATQFTAALQKMIGAAKRNRA
ncbi:MarR family winged helix-turn-helix transcriptional regulator [Moorena sp. SIO4G3]|uniref:MarR family winged helix-turn-helix transcriptional regulator n=1 Tax=Moorena sp. SIO4G3 TaxID=2607821 RepID=UPI00142C2B97|nr:MarR family winged helix-turn-helix transcriptional regulator [Moorena sp. SIO4G3]NEO82623.1 winged helix-turn-helix transcriptional regulator [Moorena sp. SIO4G3]